MNRSPIFIHSLFRTGSTYIYSTFRRSVSDYVCFQEPLHEVTLNSRENPENLIGGFSSTEMKANRHPVLEGGYFKELYEAWPEWKQFITENSIYNGYFATEETDLGLAFWNSLIESSKKRSVFQECRSSGRIQAIKQALGGHHIYLWRNPWDQWWSYKINSYFELVNHLIIHAPNSPQPIKEMVTSLGLEEFPGQKISEAFDFYRDRPQDSNNRYIIFYMLWCLGMREGLKHGNTNINIDRLSDSTEYRRTILSDLASANIHDINFDDCNISQGIYNESQQVFFRRLERRVHGWLISGGWSDAEIEEIQTLRKNYEPKVWSKSLYELQNTQLFEQLGRTSDVVIRCESELTKEAQNKLIIYKSFEALNAELESIKIDSEKISKANSNNWNQLQEILTQLKYQRNQLSQYQEQSKARLQQVLDAEKTSQTQMQSAIRKAEFKTIQLESKLLEYETKRIKLEALLDRYTDELCSVYASKSWRLTAPLRKLRQYFKIKKS